MTEEQKKIAEDNHNLIYHYLNEKKLPISEYYDILAIGLCKAAISFDPDRGAFSTLARKCFMNEIGMDIRKNTTKRNVIPKKKMVSYSGCPSDVCDILYKDRPLQEDIIISQMSSSDLLKSLSEKERVLVKGFLCGLDTNEIAEKLNCSERSIKKLRRKIKNKFLKLYNNEQC